ncbi:MAG: hypothetical protein HOV79_17020, partial [Hamadaea sp.]|nr:hypothetical protein [Hamadaea sp.]
MATKTTTAKAGTAKSTEDGFTAFERDAIKQRAKEVRAAKSAKADPEAEVLA